MPTETCDADADAELANAGNWAQVDEGDPGCDAGGDVACVFFARGMITGRSEASTELRSWEPVHVSREAATAGGGGGGGGKDVDMNEGEDEDGPAAAAGGAVWTGGTDEPLVDGVASPLGGRRGLAVGDREGRIEVCEPLGVGVGVEVDGRAECLRAPRTGMGGASGKRVGVRMRVLREGLNEGG